MAITLYTTQFCGFCLRAKMLLERKGVAYQEFAVDSNWDLRMEMMDKSGRHTVPQIWIGERHIGGCDDLYALERTGELDSLLANIQ
jgi:glutaredoxin 3